MKRDYRATPKLWEAAEKFGRNPIDLCNLILELRARVEALEAAQQPATCPHIVSSDEGTSYCRLAEQGAAQKEPEITPEEAELIAAPWSYIDPPQSTPAPTGSLVERVAGAIAGSDDPHQLWYEDARAAIREVAAWLSKESDGHLGSGAHWAGRLQREANQ